MDLLVTPAGRADAEALIAAHRESRAYHAPWAEPFTDRAGFEAWFAEVEAGRNVGLVARMGEGIVGLVTIGQIFRGRFQNAYLGFHGTAAFARQGLMTRAVARAVDHAFGPLGLHRVEANVQPGNARSLALVERVGFRREGFSPRYLFLDGAWRDHERWALTADEPRPLLP